MQGFKADRKRCAHVPAPAGILTLLCLLLVLPFFASGAQAREVKETVRVIKVSNPDPDIARAVVRVTPDKKSGLYRKEKDLVGKDFAFSQYEIDVNCLEGRVRLLSIGYLDRKGKVIYSSPVESPQWTPAVAGSASEMFRKLLCEGKGTTQKK